MQGPTGTRALAVPRTPALTRVSAVALAIAGNSSTLQVTVHHVLPGAQDRARARARARGSSRALCPAPTPTPSLAPTPAPMPRAQGRLPRLTGIGVGLHPGCWGVREGLTGWADTALAAPPAPALPLPGNRPAARTLITACPAPGWGLHWGR
jgi:hypothetical protein